MPEDTRTTRMSGAPMITFSPPDRRRWELDRSHDVPDTRARRDRRAPAEAARAVAALPAPLPSTAVLRDAPAASPARTLPGLPAAGSAYDAALAVGREHVLVVQNFAVAIVEKASGAVVRSTSLADWFPTRPPAATFVFDPRAVYDQYADRWIVMALAWDRPVLAGIQGSWLLLSVSKGADPTGEWLGSAIDTFRDPRTPEGWADYPNLGFDERAVYLTYNVRNAVARLLVFAKTDLYDDGSATPFDFLGLKNPDGRDALAVQACHHVGPSTGAHLVNTLIPGDQPSTAVVLRTVTWSAGTPSLGAPRAVSVHSYAAPPREAEQLGAKALDVGGVRVRGAVSRAGAVWLAFATGYRVGEVDDAWVAARWCRIDPATDRVRGQDELGEPGAYHVFPNLVVDAAGTLTLIASRSAPEEHPSLHYGIWPASGPAARAGVLVPGAGPHLRCRGNRPCDEEDARNGWGDYNGIGLDPVDGTTVWAFGGVGHAADPTLWATAIVSL